MYGSAAVKKTHKKDTHMPNVGGSEYFRVAVVWLLPICYNKLSFQNLKYSLHAGSWHARFEIEVVLWANGF